MKRERTQAGSIRARVLADEKTILFDSYCRDSSGRQIAKRGFRTKGEARGWLDAHVPKINAGTWRAVQPITVKAYVETWMASRAIKPSSRGAYESMAKKVVKVLGEKTIGDLTASDVNALLAAYGDQKQKTRKNLLIFIKSVLASAVADRHATEDLSKSKAIQKPKAITEDDDGQVTLDNIMVPDAIGRMLDASEDRARPLFYTLASTGARLGEALSLQWHDLDLVKGLLRIRRTVFKSAFFAPKSKAANRTVDLGPQACAMLSALKRERYGDAVPPGDDLLFPSESSPKKPMDPAALRRGAWARALRKAGLPYRKIHSLRHSFVSMLHEQGNDVAYIAQQVGHSSPVITASTYLKVLTPRRRNVVQGIEAALRVNAVSTVPTEGGNTTQHDVVVTPREVGQANTRQHVTNPLEEAKYFKAE